MSRSIAVSEPKEERAPPVSPLRAAAPGRHAAGHHPEGRGCEARAYFLTRPEILGLGLDRGWTSSPSPRSLQRPRWLVIGATILGPAARPWSWAGATSPCCPVADRIARTAQPLGGNFNHAVFAGRVRRLFKQMAEDRVSRRSP
jgi:hypothetical protein